MAGKIQIQERFKPPDLAELYVKLFTYLKKCYSLLRQRQRHSIASSNVLHTQAFIQLVGNLSDYTMYWK